MSSRVPFPLLRFGKYVSFARQELKLPRGGSVINWATPSRFLYTLIAHDAMMDMSHDPVKDIYKYK